MVKSKLLMVAMLTTLGVGPMFSSTAAAQDRDDRARHEQRVYDREHRDYHQWNTDEDRRYHEYLDEHHMKYRDFSRLNQKRQREYWRWRHDHDRDDRR